MSEAKPRQSRKRKPKPEPIVTVFDLALSDQERTLSLGRVQLTQRPRCQVEPLDATTLCRQAVAAIVKHHRALFRKLEIKTAWRITDRIGGGCVPFESVTLRGALVEIDNLPVTTAGLGLKTKILE